MCYARDMATVESHPSELDKARSALTAEFFRATGKQPPSENGRSRSAFLAGCFRILDWAESDPPCSVDDLVVFGRNEHWGTSAPRKAWDPEPVRLCAVTFPREGGGRDRYDFWVATKIAARAAGEIP